MSCPNSVGDLSLGLKTNSPLCLHPGKAQMSVQTSHPDPEMKARLVQLRIERAAYDLRRGMPVIISRAEHGAELILASELIDETVLNFLKDASTKQIWLHISDRRAEILGSQTGDADALSVHLPEQNPLKFIARMIDPARDKANGKEAPLSLPKSSGSVEGDQLIRSASIQLAKLAGLLPSTLSTPLKSDAALFDLRDQGFLQIEATEISDYVESAASHLAPVTKITEALVPLKDAAETRIVAFRPLGAAGGGPEHLALVIGKVDPQKPILVRLHSECFTGDLLGSLKCDCGDQLRGAIAAIGKEEGGILLYLAQEGRGIGLMNKLRAYQLQDQGFDTVEANLRLGFEVDERLFESAARMLDQLGVNDVRLMTNNPAKVSGIKAHGINVCERVPLRFKANEHNKSYLATKAEKTGHYL